MSTTSKRIAAFVIFCAALLVVYLVWMRSRDPDDLQLSAISTVRVTQADPSAGSTNPSAPRAARSTSSAPVPDPKIEVGDALYPNTDEAGVAWLEKNGYPTALEFAATSGRQPSLLDVDLNDGITATELLDLELVAALDEQARNDAIAQLNQAAAMGSMYALEVLGRVYASSRNYVWSEAYYKASQLRGNWAVELRMKPRQTSAEDMLSSIMAQQIIDNANKARQRHGLGPLVHDSRPGAEQALMSIRAQIQHEKQQQGEAK